MTPEQRYEDLVVEFMGEEGVLPPQGGSGFGRGALRYRRKIFAMFVRGQLVVKLPRKRVDELVAGGHGERFDANKGTPMKVVVQPGPGVGPGVAAAGPRGPGFRALNILRRMDLQVAGTLIQSSVDRPGFGLCPATL